MAKTNVTRVIKQVGKTISKHSPEILTAIGLAGGLTTVILAVKATPKAEELIKEAKEAKRKQLEEEEGTDIPEEDVTLTKKEIVKVAWKPYIPAAVTGLSSALCVIGARRIDIRRNAAVVAAWKMSETALAEYKEKVVEKVGEEKAKEIHNEVVQERVKNVPVEADKIFETGKGRELCYDYYSGRYFYSCHNAIEAAQNRINYKMNSYDFVSVNEFYDELGLPHIGLGEELGWDRNRDGLLDIDPGLKFTDDYKTCYVLDYRVSPRYRPDSYS
jgi:hypothetical protein